MITFCIAKLKGNDITCVLDSIYVQNIPNVQVLIDETPDKLTVKKNRMVRHAIHDTVVIMHDYYCLYNDWYENFRNINFEWDVLMSPIVNLDGTRFRDWCIWDDPEYGTAWMQYEPWCPNGRLNNGSPFLAPYTYNRTQYMYISGGYWVAKKDFMMSNPLDESLEWGQAEDVEWCVRVRDKWKYRLFDGVVYLSKYKVPADWEGKTIA